MEIIPLVVTHSFTPSESELQRTFPLSQGTFLHPGSVLTISIVNVTVTSPAAVAGRSADISGTAGTAQVVVTNDVANILVGFASQSLVTRVNEG